MTPRDAAGPGIPPRAALPALMDANCAVGEWPFRRVPCAKVERLLTRMDTLGIARAAVSRLETVFHKDCLVGNRELAALVAPHAGRLFPLYTLNPAFPGWEEDLEVLVAGHGLRAGGAGLRLYPNYHAYPLDGTAAGALLERAATLDLPLVVSARLEDERTHHWLCRVPAVPLEQLAAAVLAFPRLRWVLAGLRAPQIVRLWRDLTARGLPAGAPLLFDLSLVQGPLDECALLATAVGVAHLAFGTNLPLTLPEATRLSLQEADLDSETKAQIGAGNALRVLCGDAGAGAARTP